MASGNSSTKASRRDTQFTLRSKSAGQFLQPIADVLLQFGKEPTLFERAPLLGPAQGTVQQQRFGFAHGLQDRFDGGPPHLLEGRDALVVVDHQVAVGPAFRRL